MHVVIPPDVSAKADQMKGFKNPYILLRDLEVLCSGNETLEECLHGVINLSIRYAETVCRFEQIVAQGQISNENGMRKQIEEVRSTTHDTTINEINILSRVLKNQGKDNTWLKLIAASGRAGYAKFAILTAFQAVLSQPTEVPNV